MAWRTLPVTVLRKQFAPLRDLGGEPSPGVPRKIGDEKMIELLWATLDALPATATHSSTRSMANASTKPALKNVTPDRRMAINATADREVCDSYWMAVTYLPSGLVVWS